jgi:hypothetical protein
MSVKGDLLEMFVIYERPSDFPESYVVRRHVVEGAGSRACTEPLCIVPTLEAARAAIPRGVLNIGRLPEDEPEIVEVWI